MIELNHAAALSMVDGPARALDLIDALEARGGLKGYELLPAVRADLLRRLGRRDAAREAYLKATAATQLEPLRRFYARRIAEMDSGGFSRLPGQTGAFAQGSEARSSLTLKGGLLRSLARRLRELLRRNHRVCRIRRQARQQRVQRA